jgi:hypothetical protein
MAGFVHSPLFLELCAQVLPWQVSSSFGNASYISGACQTPIPPDMAGGDNQVSCIEIEHSGQAYVLHDLLAEAFKLTVKQVS